MGTLGVTKAKKFFFQDSIFFSIQRATQGNSASLLYFTLIISSSRFQLNFFPCRLNIQREPENSGIGSRLLDLSFNFKYSNEHEEQQLSSYLTS